VKGWLANRSQNTLPYVSFNTNSSKSILRTFNVLVCICNEGSRGLEDDDIAEVKLDTPHILAREQHRVVDVLRCNLQ
jgi:hypothetical protein